MFEGLAYLAGRLETARNNSVAVAEVASILLTVLQVENKQPNHAASACLPQPCTNTTS